jgi:hypothetical protein
MAHGATVPDIDAAAANTRDRKKRGAAKLPFSFIAPQAVDSMNVRSTV